MPKMGEGYLPLLYIPDGAGRYVKCPVLTTTQRDALTGVEGMIIFNSTTDQLEEYDGATWEAVGQVILDTHAALFGLHNRVVRKTADQTVNDSETLVNDTHLLAAIGANEIWVFEAVIEVNGGSTPDFDFTFTVPSGGSMTFGKSDSESKTSRATEELRVQGQNVASIVVLWGIVRNGATAGNLQLQWAQGAATASDCTVLTDSCLILGQLV